MKLLVSACLLGICCRYNGGHCFSPSVLELQRIHQLIPICPEQMGGLATPRPPAERLGSQVFSKTGENLTASYAHGASQALALARRLGVKGAILKSRSPSCGSGFIYNGRFDGTLVPGWGVTAQLFAENGITILDENQLDRLLTLPAPSVRMD